MANSNYDEIRRVRHQMSREAGHDARKLIAKINENRKEYSLRIISPGDAAEQCDAPKPPITGLPDRVSSAAAG